MEQLSSTRRTFMEIDIWLIFEKSVEKIQVSLKSDKKNDTLHKDQYICMCVCVCVCVCVLSYLAQFFF